MTGHEPITVIVLAAGRGERFIASGGTCPKLEARLNGRRVLDWVVDAVRASGLPWHVVEPPASSAGTLGMGDSIARGVEATRHAAGWLILPADLPLIESATLLKVANALPDASVAVPMYRGKRGHPVGFAAECGPQLAALKGEQGAKSIVSSWAASQDGASRVVCLEIDDPGCVCDVDTVGALRQAELLQQQRGMHLSSTATRQPHRKRG